MENEYLSVIEKERGELDPSVFTHAHRLLTKEHDLVEKGNKYLEIHSYKKCRISAKVIIPDINLVGKLLGRGGSTLKEISQATGCKLSILGKGSMKDKDVEEENRNSNDPKFHHLHDELHIQVETLAPPLEGYGRLAAAMSELQPILQGDDGYGGRDSFSGRGQRHMMPHRGSRGAFNGRGGRMAHCAHDPYGGGIESERNSYDYNQESGNGQNNHYEYVDDYGHQSSSFGKTPRGRGGSSQNNHYNPYEDTEYGDDYGNQSSSFSKTPHGIGGARGRRPYSPHGGSRGDTRGSPLSRGARGHLSSI